MKIKYTSKRPMKLTMTTDEKEKETLYISQMNTSRMITPKGKAHDRPAQFDNEDLPAVAVSWLKAHRRDLDPDFI